jgi:hypothetical protein
MYTAQTKPIDSKIGMVWPKRFIVDGISGEVDVTYSLYIIL